MRAGREPETEVRSITAHAQIFMRFENVIRGMALVKVARPSGKVAQALARFLAA